MFNLKAKPYLAHRPNEDLLSSLIQRHLSWEKLMRTVAWLLRFKSWFITRYSQRSKNASVKMLSVDKLQRAEREIVKHVQGILLPEALQALQKISSAKYSRQVTAELKKLKMSPFMRKLHLLLDEFGILWVGGRLENALISCKASCYPLSASCHRSDNLSASSKNRSSWSGVCFVQFTSAVLDN